jgi:hypothetical protein
VVEDDAVGVVDNLGFVAEFHRWTLTPVTKRKTV